mmetsp:Transcript_44795/g.148474  ORF Transcript_44795/g.148474 Transcript_44795/m.148474 type:complete len:283 (-) Transcript_44795:437-1285(-)
MVLLPAAVAVEARVTLIHHPRTPLPALPAAAIAQPAHRSGRPAVAARRAPPRPWGKQRRGRGAVGRRAREVDPVRRVVSREAAHPVGRRPHLRRPQLRLPHRHAVKVLRTSGRAHHRQHHRHAVLPDPVADLHRGLARRGEPGGRRVGERRVQRVRRERREGHRRRRKVDGRRRRERRRRAEPAGRVGRDGGRRCDRDGQHGPPVPRQRRALRRLRLRLRLRLRRVGLRRRLMRLLQQLWLHQRHRSRLLRLGLRLDLHRLLLLLQSGKRLLHVLRRHYHLR